MACRHKRYTVDTQEQTGKCIDCGAEGRMQFVVPLAEHEIMGIAFEQRFLNGAQCLIALGRGIEAAHGIQPPNARLTAPATRAPKE